MKNTEYTNQIGKLDIAIRCAAQHKLHPAVGVMASLLAELLYAAEEVGQVLEAAQAYMPTMMERLVHGGLMKPNVQDTQRFQVVVALCKTNLEYNDWCDYHDETCTEVIDVAKRVLRLVDDKFAPEAQYLTIIGLVEKAISNECSISQTNATTTDAEIMSAASDFFVGNTVQ